MFSWATSFIFKSNPFSWNKTVYYHQLSEVSEGYSFVPRNEDISDIYEEFDTLVHATSFKSLGEIFEEGVIKPRFVKDSSVCNPEQKLYSLSGEKAEVGFHPLARSKIVWYGPYTKEKAEQQTESIERYGNIMFSLKCLHGFEGLIRESLNHYLVEVIHYKTQTATRILVTNKEYPTLQRYDPYTEGGPWWYDNVNDKHWCLTKTIHYFTKKEVRNTVEFMKEEFDLEYHRKWWLENHELSYKTCFKERSGVELSNDIDESILRLVLGTIAYKQMQRGSREVKMPSCIQLVEIPDDRYEQIFLSLDQIQSKRIQNTETGDTVQGDNDDRVPEIRVGVRAMLELMQNSKYCEIGSHLLEMNNLFRTQTPFRYVDSAEFTKALLIFFRQEFFDVQRSLEEKFEAILQFLQPDEIIPFFSELKSLINETIRRKKKEVLY